MEAIWKYWYTNDLIFIFGPCIFTISGKILSVLVESEYNKRMINIFIFVICTLFLAFITSLYVYTEYINPKAHYENALKFYMGDDFSPDLETAISAFEKAVDNNHVESCRILSKINKAKGEIYLSGKWLQKGIELGDAESAKMLGELYDRNRFTNLTEQERVESAYLAFSEALCLGEISVRHRVNVLQTKVSEAIQKIAESDCRDLKQHLGR